MKIDLTEVETSFRKIENANKECVKDMGFINSFYIEGTKAHWDSPAAATYIDSLTSKFNNYINQINIKFQEGMQDFTRGVNRLTMEQNAKIIAPPCLADIPKLSRSWEAKSERFSVPDDYASFTKNNLIVGINYLKDHINIMRQCIDTAVDNGLANEFCTNLKGGLNSLFAGASKIADEYCSDAAKKAIEEDEKIRRLKNNT